ncbi:hypothetical protein SAMN04487949_1228 [Halogranum gelatinilyticum]|uniref:Uncharacterized protein n=1 Tax=Halogranum gelatinilyticum TaxID=660521 RepID=A0A1G9RAK5_9EURY|nr:hypothetical protein [Halogranum gelatinilyticum]SDM19435.1 hypothetical protein SAMN04487949_1228 [Halogranum gelatinilyticum]
MQPSRRAVLGAVGSSVLALSAGCTGALPTSSGSEQTSDVSATDAPATGGTSTGSDGAAFEARLHGPEREWLLFDGTDLERVGDVRTTDSGMVGLPVLLTEAALADVTETFREAGVAENRDAFEIVQTYDGDETGRFGISASLVEAITDGEWDGQLLLSFENREQAERVRAALVASSDA